MCYKTANTGIYTYVYIDIYFFYFRIITFSVPKLRHNLDELRKFIFEVLTILFPKIHVYLQPLPPLINCQFNITEYGMSEYICLLILIIFNCDQRIIIQFHIK